MVKNLKLFPTKLDFPKMLSLITSKHLTGNSNEWDKGNKKCTDLEGRNKTVLFSGDRIIYVENSKEMTENPKNLLGRWVGEGGDE